MKSIYFNKNIIWKVAFHSEISLNVTVVSVGIVFCVIVYFFFFLFVMSNLKIGLTLYKLCLPFVCSAIALLLELTAEGSRNIFLLGFVEFGV